MSSSKTLVIVLVAAAVASVFALGMSRAEQKPVVSGPATENVMFESEGALAPQELVIKLEEKLPGIEISDIETSPVNGFYQVFFSGQLLYVSDDGRYLFTGNLLELADQSPINHSEMALAARDAKRAPERAAQIASMSESEMVVFKAPEEKYVITVFTDVDCAYCRKLHREVPELNEQGVTVRYLAFPRAGVGSDAYKKLVSVWCSDDRMTAMDDAKLKRKFSDKSCNNPVADQYQLTRQFNLSGTPALILSDGELIGGYVPSADLVKHLNQKQAATVTSSGS